MKYSALYHAAKRIREAILFSGVATLFFPKKVLISRKFLFLSFSDRAKPGGRQSLLIEKACTTFQMLSPTFWRLALRHSGCLQILKKLLLVLFARKTVAVLHVVGQKFPMKIPSLVEAPMQLPQCHRKKSA